MHLPDLEYDWTRIYGNVLEEIPKDAPEPLGKSVTTTTFLDANLLHDLITGRSVTAVLHFFNLTPGDWYSKRQATVENATYGSEFVAAKTATEQIVDIRQTLRYYKPHDQKELQGITHHYILYSSHLFIYFI